MTNTARERRRTLENRLAALAAALFLGAAPGAASATEPRGLGAGLLLGNPLGATAKYWLGPTGAVEGAVGWSGDAALYGGYLWHGWKAFPQPRRGRVAAHVGAGLRLETKDDAEFGLRLPFGADYWVEDHPLEISLDIAPVIRLTPGASLGLDAALGLRYYFTRWN